MGNDAATVASPPVPPPAAPSPPLGLIWLAIGNFLLGDLAGLFAVNFADAARVEDGDASGLYGAAAALALLAVGALASGVGCLLRKRVLGRRLGMMAALATVVAFVVGYLRLDGFGSPTAALLLATFGIAYPLLACWLLWKRYAPAFATTPGAASERPPLGVFVLAIVNLLLGMFAAVIAYVMWAEIVRGTLAESMDSGQQFWMGAVMAVIAAFAVGSGIGYLLRNRFLGRTVGIAGALFVMVVYVVGFFSLGLANLDGSEIQFALFMGAFWLGYPLLTLFLIGRKYKAAFVA